MTYNAATGFRASMQVVCAQTLKQGNQGITTLQPEMLKCSEQVGYYCGAVNIILGYAMGSIIYFWKTEMWLHVARLYRGQAVCKCTLGVVNLLKSLETDIIHAVKIVLAVERSDAVSTSPSIVLHVHRTCS